MAMSASCGRQPGLHTPLAAKIEAAAKARAVSMPVPVPVLLSAPPPDPAIAVLKAAAAEHYNSQIGHTTSARHVALFLLGEHIGTNAAAEAFSTVPESVLFARARLVPLVAMRAMVIEPTRNCFAELFTMLVDDTEQIRPTRKALIKLCADACDISVEDILSQRRLKSIVRVRQLAMFLCKRFTLSSFPEIGRSFDGRDHTTVLHAARKIEKDARDYGIDGGGDPAAWAQAFADVWRRPA